MRIQTTVLAVTCLLAACATESALDSSLGYLDEGDQEQAFARLDAEREQQLATNGTVDAQLDAAWRRLRVSHLVHAAREAIYADQEDAALSKLDEVAMLDAENKTAAELRARAHRKLANRALLHGQECLARRELDKAVAWFNEALRHQPGFPKAEEGMAAVRVAVSNLHEQAQQQFLEAIRKLPEFRFNEVDWHAAIAMQRDPTRKDAEDVRQRALREKAQIQRERAEQSQKLEAYGAALLGYRAARDLWPQMPGIDDAVAQMQREVQAQWRTESAALLIRADRLVEARKLLQEAFELSTCERGTINELQFEARKREAMHAYDQARDLELQGKKAESLAAFAALAQDWPDGLVDEKTRIGALRSDIQAAEKAFAEGEAAEQAQDPKAALEHYRAAATYYADYKDTRARIERLRAAQSDRSGS